MAGRPVVELIAPNGSKLAQAAGGEGAVFSQAVGRVPEADCLSVGWISEQAEQLLEPFATTIPLTVLDREGDAPGVAVPADDRVSSGFNKDGRIRLVREGLPDDAAVLRTVWHELVHFGLRRFLTREQYVRQMNQLFFKDAWIRQHAQAWVARVQGQALRDAGHAPGHIRARGVDEALAELAEIRLNPRRQPLRARPPTGRSGSCRTSTRCTTSAAA